MYVYVQYEGPPYFRTSSTCIIRVCSPAAYYGSIYTLYFLCMLDEGTRTVISSKVLSYESTSVFTCACTLYFRKYKCYNPYYDSQILWLHVL
jgi:hypothetical protein